MHTANLQKEWRKEGKISWKKKNSKGKEYWLIKIHYSNHWWEEDRALPISLSIQTNTEGNDEVNKILYENLSDAFDELEIKFQKLKKIIFIY